MVVVSPACRYLDFILKQEKVLMLVRRTLFLVVIALGLVAAPSQALSQTSLHVLEGRFLQADSLFRAELAHRDSLSRQAEELANRIADLKSQPKLNYFQRRRLESLLRNSQQLSRRIEDADRLLSQREERRGRLGTELLAAYAKAIGTKLAMIEKAPADETTRLSAELEALRMKQARLQQRLAEPAPPIRLVPVRIDSQDTAVDIRQKADLLRDQEDKIRARRRWLERKARQIASEVELRQRMREFVDEVALFDPTEEGLSDQAVRAASQPAITSVRSEADRAFGQVSAPANLFLTPRQWEALSSPGRFSQPELQALLKALKKEQSKLAAQADSLHQLATRFTQRAEALEHTRRPDPK